VSGEQGAVGSNAASSKCLDDNVAGAPSEQEGGANASNRFFPSYL